jgi:hypothetical protein
MHTHTHTHTHTRLAKIRGDTGQVKSSRFQVCVCVCSEFWRWWGGNQYVMCVTDLTGVWQSGVCDEWGGGARARTHTHTHPNLQTHPYAPMHTLFSALREQHHACTPPVDILSIFCMHGAHMVYIIGGGRGVWG